MKKETKKKKKELTGESILKGIYKTTKQVKYKCRTESSKRVIIFMSTIVFKGTAPGVFRLYKVPRFKRKRKTAFVYILKAKRLLVMS